MTTINHDGRVLHFHEVGAGLPVLLVHAFPLSSQGFWPQLEAGIEGARLIVPDLCGFGSSSPGPASLDGFADDCVAILDALGLSSALVGGVSMGGYVAMALARRSPGRVRGLLLVDTQSTADDDAGRARREALALEVLAQGAGVVVQGLLPRLLTPSADPAVRARVEALMRAASPAAIAGASRAMAARVDGKDILSRFAGPCTVVVGALDALTGLDKAKAMADLAPEARLEVIDGAGHLSNLEKPNEFNKILTTMVARLAAL
jgi:pimeloyl-ACP methyl ester carboxylesterase